MIDPPHLWNRIGWEVAQALGMLAVLCCVGLCLLPVRPRRQAPRPLSLRRHELIGWLALAAVLLHMLLLLLLDHRVVEDFKLTGPWYEGAGILALAVLLWLTVPSSGSLRQRLWSRHRAFQAQHVALTCLLLVALAVHVLVTARYLHRRAAALAYLALCALALLALLRLRPQPARSPGFMSKLVFGRNTTWILAATVLSLVALSLLLLPAASLALREPVVTRSAGLAIDFPHDKHRPVRCVQCHHNFIDHTGDGGCISCHRSARADLRVGAEARFHDFCLGCHRDPPPEFEHHGPVNGCRTCHL